MLDIREATPADYEAIWAIFREVVAGQDAFPFAPDITREEALRAWAGPGMKCYVAARGRQIVGSSYIKANQPGLGAHVANAGFMVSATGRGRGVGQALGEHALREAVRLGYTAMQFNFVVSSNTAAVRLWKALGFVVVGTVPGAFRHGQFGATDVYIMHRFLDREPAESGAGS